MSAALTDMALGTGWTLHALRRGGVVGDWVSADWSDPVDDLRPAFRSAGLDEERDRWILTRNPDADPVKRALLAAEPMPDPTFDDPPAEDRPVTWAGRAGTWRRTSVPEDGFLEWGGFAWRPLRARGLAATTLCLPSAGPVQLRLAATGPLVVAVDGSVVHRDDICHSLQVVERKIELALGAGRHDLAVACAQVGFRDYRHLLRVAVVAHQVWVAVRSPGADPNRTLAAERRLDEIGVVGRTGTRWWLYGPEDAELTVSVEGSKTTVVLEGGHVALDPTTLTRDDDAQRPLSQMRRGDVVLRLGVPDATAPVVRDMVVGMPMPAADEAQGGPASWRAGLLHHAAAAGAATTAGLLAGLLLGRTDLPRAALRHSLEMVRGRSDCADFEALALLQVLARARDTGLNGGLIGDLEESLGGFRYWLDQPGLDCMCFFTENHQIAFHAAEALAGELLDPARFTGTGWPAARHREHGAARALAWMRRKCREGFIEFDSNTYMAIDVLALVSLADLSSQPRLASAAAATLDRLLLQLAVNSWRGIHGCAHGRAYGQALLCPRLEETAPIQHLLSGLGGVNGALLPAVALAAADRYVVPAALRGAAEAVPHTWDARQRQAGDYDPQVDLAEGRWSSASVVWKTPDGMLASAQEHRPGQPGRQEHVWGATLSADVHVFANSPACSSLATWARPNYWAGNRLMPLVRQHRDALLALYRVESHDPLGGTHAWFPTPAMDEWCHHGAWLCGRVGEGYVAIAADARLDVMQTGATAATEARPAGPGRAWVCQLGRRADHGSFADFARGLHPPLLGSDRAEYRTPAGTHLELSWQEGWRVAGRREPVEAFPHLDTPIATANFGDRRLTVKAGGSRHVLDLTDLHREERP